MNRFGEFSIEVMIEQASGLRKLMVRNGESLMDALIREGFHISAFCGGMGRCGKCRVKVCNGNASVSTEDAKLFSKEELENGWRLSCMLYPKEPLTIQLDINEESKFEVVSKSDFHPSEERNLSDDNEEEYALAVDIGTTTLVLELLNPKTGVSLHTTSMVNSQRKYGADVISRIQSSTEGRKKELQATIVCDLQQGIRKLEEECQIHDDKIKSIVIAGNTTMIHLLMGYDCESLGVFPFTPVNIGMIQEKATQILGICQNAEVTVLPGISTYVGGDIVSGLYAAKVAESDDISLLIDLGTNGEMALGNREKILVTSTAAGPAFEGGNISCGTGSIAGAICSVNIGKDKMEVKTIQGEEPCGVCGTGVVETTAELVRSGIVDETGLLEGKYFESGFLLAEASDGKKITFTQKDIRETQLAKAAIRAGIEVLLLRYGITTEQIGKVYLAGGFGYRLDTTKAVLIGMLPEKLSNKIETVGNSSLAGAVKYLQREENEELQKIISVSKEIALANDKIFNEFYMNYMIFNQN